MRLFVGLLLVCGACSEQVVVRETPAKCGNGDVEADEACDDGNEIATDACTDGCEVAACGDGVTRMDLGPNHDLFEQCDDGNDADDDACRSNCRSAVCGDGIVRTDVSEGEPGFEACDDGNIDELDGCTRNCDSGIDSDGDSHIDPADNCPQTPNADQTDTDGDGAGDACDPNPDRRDYKLRSRLDVTTSAPGASDDHKVKAVGGRAVPSEGASRQYKLRGGVRLGAP